MEIVEERGKQREDEQSKRKSQTVLQTAAKKRGKEQQRMELINKKI